MTNTHQPKSYDEFDKREWWNEAEKEIFKKVTAEKLPESVPDAVVWIEGDARDRVDKTMEVLEYYNHKPKLILSGGLEGNPYRPDSDLRPDGGNIPSWEIKEEFLERGVDKENIILEDESRNGLEQAINDVEIAKKRDYDSLVLVASTWHQPRLFLTFVNQLHEQDALDIELINQPETSYPLDRKIPGRGKDTLEMLQEDLWKITEYNENGTVAKAEVELEYLERFEKEYEEVSEKIEEIVEEIELKK
ncbi:MAG: YdcF family protein [Candidatus Magasanikbacteria bacterium]